MPKSSKGIFSKGSMWKSCTRSTGCFKPAHGHRQASLLPLSGSKLWEEKGLSGWMKKEKAKWWEVAFWLHRPSYGCFSTWLLQPIRVYFIWFKIYGNPSLIHLFVACTNQTCCRYLESSFAQEKKCVDRWLKLFSCCWKTWHCHCRHTHALKFEHTQSDISPMETLALRLVRFICFLLLHSFYKHFLIKEAVYSTFLFLFLVSVTFSCK